jgi:hypothetical protein
MVKIMISPQAHSAIAETLSYGSVAVEPVPEPDGRIGVWLDPTTVAKLKAMRGLQRCDLASCPRVTGCVTAPSVTACATRCGTGLRHWLIIVPEDVLYLRREPF